MSVYPFLYRYVNIEIYGIIPAILLEQFWVVKSVIGNSSQFYIWLGKIIMNQYSTKSQSSFDELCRQRNVCLYQLFSKKKWQCMNIHYWYVNLLMGFSYRATHRSSRYPPYFYFQKILPIYTLFVFTKCDLSHWVLSTVTLLVTVSLDPGFIIEILRGV